MKMIEQYVEVVGRSLPFRSRREVRTELRSLLMDELEERYGADAEEKNVREMLLNYGSPASVAARYRGEEQFVIAPGLTSFFFLLLKIVLGSIALAFAVLAVLGILQGNTTGSEALTFLQRTLNAWVGAFTFVTLGFMAATRFRWVTEIDPEADWSPDDLADVETGVQLPSKKESAITAAILVIMIIVLNLFPGLVTLGEDHFMRSGVELHHRISLPVFRGYVLILTVVWVAELVYLALVQWGKPSAASRLPANLELALSVVSAVILSTLVLDPRVYAPGGGLLGFRFIFLVVAVVQVWEAGHMLYRRLRDNS